VQRVIRVVNDQWVTSPDRTKNLFFCAVITLNLNVSSINVFQMSFIRFTFFPIKGTHNLTGGGVETF